MDHFVATAFEVAAITFTGRLAQAGELDFIPERIGGWWNRDAEIDVLAINLTEKIALVRECKWTIHPDGASILDDLKQKVEVLMKDHDIKKVQFALFSRSGFIADMEAKSKNEGGRLQQHRYCQALMKARHGETVLLDASGIACPAAAAAFGFRPLPEGLKSGQGLVGFGIVSDPEVGRKMFENMPHLLQGKLTHLKLFPLEQAHCIPDVIIVEDEVEKLMWLNLAYLNVTGGQRLTGSTAILQATYVDSTIIPYLEKRLNFEFGCYGCREATDLSPNETVIGFPVGYLSDMVKPLENLSQKAIPNSRSKKVYENIIQRTKGTT